MLELILHVTSCFSDVTDYFFLNKWGYVVARDFNYLNNKLTTVFLSKDYWPIFTLRKHNAPETNISPRSQAWKGLYASFAIT